MNLTNISELELKQFTFGSIDYAVFVVMLSISAAVGIYFGFFDKSANTTDEYLMGGRRMKTLPIAISLVASQISGILLMAIPGEMYAYGVNYFFSILTIVIPILIICWVVIPVFYYNNISNCYEYLEMRFNRSTRELVTAAFVGTFFLVLPVYNYIPSLAFAQVTNINIHLTNAIVSSICVFYTMMGGIKAVVWTDVIQATIMVGTVIFVCFIGIAKVGGFSEVIRIAGEGHRLDINFSWDLRSRMTIWNVSLSSICSWVSYIGFNQSCVQRIVSLPSLSHARKSLVLFCFGCLITLGCVALTGFVIYARYSDCDPIKAGFVNRPDKILPYFVQDIAGHLKGVPGLFISCVFSAALSTISAMINSLSGILYMDYIKPRINHSESKANLIMKGLVLLFGIYCVLGGVIVEKFSSIIQLVFTIGGTTIGSIFSVFLMGMLIPRVHGRAAFWSVISSIIIMLIIVIGSQGRLHYNTLPTSTEGCVAGTFNQTLSSQNIPILQQLDSQDTHQNFSIFDISSMWYLIFGAGITFLVGIPLSYILPTEKNKQIDPKLYSPIIQRFIKYQLTATDDMDEVNTKWDNIR